MGIKAGIVPILLASAVALTGCSSATTSEAPQSSAGQSASGSVNAMLTSLNIDTTSARTIVDGLDALPLEERPSDLMASVQPRAVVLQPGAPDEQVLPFQADEFYLSIAPFREQTHACTFHSLTTCVGEMQSEEVSIKVADAATGDVVVERETRTASNGFVGVWLPSGGEFVVTITSGDQSAEAAVSTGDGDLTCLTTMQLT